MSSIFGADPALIVTGISAILQASQTWMAYRDAKRAGEVFRIQMRQGASTHGLQDAAKQLGSIAPPKVVQSLGRRVEKCWTRYDDILNSNEGVYLPQEVDDATAAVGRCVCSELRRLIKVNGSLPAGDFQKWWSHFRCS